MTLSSLKKLTLQIKDALIARTTGGPLLVMAQEYAKYCEYAVARLEVCCAMLEKGSDYQALQLAEADPPLPDVMAMLSFTERSQWLDYCRVKQLAVPPIFEAINVKAMDAMYARGITSAHPLYKDYRGAISKKDDVAALQIVRTITRLNSSDSNAQKEQTRLEEKRLRECVIQLNNALEAGVDDKAVQLTAELEILATTKRLEAIPEYVRGRAVQHKVAQQKALQFVRETLSSLHAEQKSGNWQSASAGLARIDQACMEHGLPLPLELQPIAREVQAWVTAEEKRSADEYDFRQRLDAAVNLAADIESKLSTVGYKPAEARARLTGLEYAWEAVRRCEKEVPGDGQKRVESAANALAQELEQMRRRKRVLIIGLSGAALVALLFLGWAGYSYYTAEQYVARFKEMQPSGRVEDAEKLIADLTENKAGLLGWAGLEGAVADAKTWVRGERIKLTTAENKIKELEGQAENQFSGRTAADLQKDLKVTKDLVTALAPSLGQSLQSRLAALSSAVDARVKEMQRGEEKLSEEQLAQVEKLLSPLSMQSRASELRAALAEVRPLLKKLQAKKSQAGKPSEADQTERLSPALEIRLSEAEKAAAEYGEEIAGLTQASDALTRVETLEAFTAALNLFSKLKLAEVLPAKTAALGVPKADKETLAAILYDDPVRRRAALTARKGSALLHPEQVLSPDLTILLKIRDDKNLNEVYQVKWSLAGEPRFFYSLGKPKEIGVATAMSYSGKFYQPTERSSIVNFQDRKQLDLGEQVEIKKSRTSSFLESLFLELMTDADGENYKKELLPVFDLLARDILSPASAKAYIWDKLAEIIQRDRDGWGLALSPLLQEDLKRFKDIPKPQELESSAWMLFNDASNSSAYANFFKTIQGRSYSGEVATKKGVEDKILGAGIRFAGYTDEKGVTKMIPGATNSGEYWFKDRIQQNYRLLKAGPNGALDAKDAAPFSALFVIPVDRKEIKEQMSKLRSLGLGPFFKEP